MINMAALTAFWETTVEAYGAPRDAAGAAFRDVVAAYAEPWRRYHSLSHVVSVLDWIEGAQAQAEDLRALRLAAWYHDSVFDPGAPDNEERSAWFARRGLASMGMPVEVAGKIEALILATKTHAYAGEGRDASILIDADLAVLAAPRDAYWAYAAALREEYGHAADEEYKPGRAAILREFLARPAIYFTAWGRETLEASARRNLQEEADWLAENPGY